MQEVRSNTTELVTVGPFISSNGSTLVTTVTLATCEQAEFVSNNTDQTLDISGFTMTALTGVDGYYGLVMTDDSLPYRGRGTIAISSARTALPVRCDIMVLSEYEWDRKYLDTGVNSGLLSGVPWYGSFSSIIDTTITLGASHNLADGRVWVSLTSGTNAIGKSRIGTLATNTVTVDPTWTSDGETIPSGTLKGYVGCIPKSPTASVPGVNVLQVSGDGPAADNLEAAFDGTGYSSKLTVAGVADASTLTVAGVTNSSAWTIAGDTNTAALIGALNDIDGSAVTLGTSAITIAGVTNVSAEIAALNDIDGSAVSVHPTSVVSANIQSINDVSLTGDGSDTPFTVAE